MTVRKNPRSTIRIGPKLFTKTSKDVHLSKEAAELDRCRVSNIRTQHISALEVIEFNNEKNILTTRTVANGQSLFNKLWNETSVVRRLLGRGIDENYLLMISKEIGEWLRLYHSSTDFSFHTRHSILNFTEMFEEKLGYIQKYKIMRDSLIDKIRLKCLPEIKSMADEKCRKIHKLHFCMVHGDFNAYNMLVDSKWNVYITDFADAHIMANIEDFGRFYELFAAFGSTGSYRRKLFNKAINIFTSAYGASPAIHHSPALRTIRIYNVLIHLISEHAMKPYVKNQWLTRFEINRISKVSLRWLHKELSFTA